MFRRYLVIICAALSLVVSAAVAQAQLPQISSGLTYLTSSQNLDGTWGSGTSIVETTAVTVSALETLKLLNQTAGTTYTTGISWLQSQTPKSVDYIARRVLTLGLTDGSVNALLPALDTLKGAWGGDEGYLVNNLDTTLALIALKTANYPNNTIINPALAYLTGSQNADGGWGFTKGDDSNVYMTAVVSATLQQFPQMTPIATAVNRATSYLLVHQNTDGGFGSSPSTVFETALAYAALAAFNTNESALSNAVNYLTATQSTNGSWVDDPYSTALALKALYLSENRPSPPPPPPAGGKLSGLVVDAITRQPVAGVVIALASNNLINSSSDSSGRFTLADVPPGSQTVNLTLTGFAPTSAAATAVADSTVNLGTIPIISASTTGTIAGNIADSSGRPLANVTITVSGAWSGSSSTAADGSYSFTFVTPGQVSITATKTGFQNITAPGTVYARSTLSFSPRMSTTQSQLTTGTLVGRVVDSYWGLPIDSLAEEKGVTVTLSGGISVEPDPNNRGMFEIKGLAANTYQVIVGKNGFATQAFRAVITPGGITDLGTIRLEMSVSKMALTGKVTDASTGAPLVGAEVTIVGADLTGRTDSAGVYAITDIPVPGIYNLKVSASGYIQNSYTLGSAPWTQTMDLALSPLVTKGGLNGTVVDVATNQPLAGVQIALVTDSSVSTSTDSAGIFTLTALPRGVQQLTIALDGYSSRTLTTAITVGAVSNVGTIPLAITPLPASIQGTVRNGVTNTPFAGVAVKAVGSGSWQTVTAPDGSYKMDDIAPGVVTVAAHAVPAAGYQPARISTMLEPGGLLVFNPVLSTMLAGNAGMTMQTDKAVYIKGETVGVSINLSNYEAMEYSALLYLQAIDPSGMTIYETSLTVNLPAEGNLLKELSFALPATIGGSYSVRGDLHDDSGRIIASSSKNLGVATSRITVTPTLPQVLVAADNVIPFQLVNDGTLAVSAGTLTVTLKEPDGQPVSATTQSFTLAQGESRSITATVSLPSLKFGSYTLSYSQSDESKTGERVDIPISNSLSITPRFDKPSYRVREKAALLVTLGNTGRFAIDSTGTTVTVSVPAVGYTEIKPLAVPPAASGASFSELLFDMTIPETMIAGQYGVKIAVTLPSGSTTVQTAQLIIPESALTLSPLKATYLAGETIQPVFANSGGVDEPVQYRLELYDAKSALIAEATGTQTTAAGSSMALSLLVPTEAVEGSYNLLVNFKELKSGKEGLLPNPVTINGVKGSLQVKTDKEVYLMTENITAGATLTNSGTPLTGGNLHLQVTTGPGAQRQKTWTTQADFQTWLRNGVDTYGVNDWIIPDDDFSGSTINGDRWKSYVYNGGVLPAITGEQLQLETSGVTNSISGVISNFQLDGDFDTQIDYEINLFMNNNSHAVFVASFDDGSYFRVGRQGNFYQTYKVWPDDNQVTYTTDTKGKFRLTRTGNVAKTWYWNGTQWINQSTWTVSTMPARINLQTTSFLGTEKLHVKFDNFKVNSGRIKTENQTVDSVRLLPLNDNFDDGVLNRDRWDLWGKSDANESGGVFHLTSSASSVWHGITLKAPLMGDFSAVSKYKNFVSTPNLSLGTYHMLATDGPTGYYIIRASANTSHSIQGLSFLTGNIYYWGSYFPYLPDTGSFRLRKEGVTGFTDYWNGSGWTNVYSESRLTSEPVKIKLYTLSSEAGQPTISADLDSFYTYSGVYAPSGTISLKQDSGMTNAKWGKIIFTATQPAGTLIKFRTRTAETAVGLTTSIWSDYLTTSGSAITSPGARWIEVEATLATANTNVTPLLHDVTVTYTGPPNEILWQTDVPVNLSQNAVSELNKTIGTLGVIGKLYLQGVVTSATGQTVASSEYPFYIAQGNTLITMATDKKLYRPGEPVTISGQVKNLATIAATNLSLVLKTGTGQTLYTEIINIPAGGTYPFSTTTTAEGSGLVALFTSVSQNSAILAEIADQYEIALPNVTAVFSAPDATANEPFAVTLALNNSGKTDATIGARISDDAGIVAEIQQLTIPAGESRLLQYIRQITAANSYTAVLSGDLNQTLTKSVAYAANPATTIDLVTKIVTDKIYFNANEQVAITAKVTNRSADFIAENLSAIITVIDSQGRVLYTDQSNIAQLLQGQTATINRYWNSGASPAGNYTVRIVLVNVNTLLSMSSGTFELLASSQTVTGLGTALKGTIAAAQSPVEFGRDGAINFSVSNRGNEDLSSLVINLIVADPETQQVVQSRSWNLSLQRNGSVSDQVTLPAALLAIRPYLALLQVATTTLTEPKTIASVTFEVKDLTPPLLTLSTLADGSNTNIEILNIAGRVVDNNAVKELTINGQAVAVALDGSFSHALPLVAGANKIITLASDLSGNQSSDTRTIKLDLAAPVVVITAPADNSKTALQQVEVSGTVDEEAVVQIKVKDILLPVSRNGNCFTAMAQLAAGINTIELTAVDLAGNQTQLKRTLLYDNGVPSLAITNPPQDIRTKQSSIILQGTVTDTLTKVSVTVEQDGVLFTPPVVDGVFTQTIDFTTEKTYQLAVTATNEVGSSVTAQRNIIYDITPPQLSINQVTTPTNQPNQMVSGTREDGLPVEVTCATATVGTVSYPTATSWQVDIAWLTAGENLVTASSTDLAGNVASATTLIVFSAEAPVIAISATPTTLWPPNHKMVPVRLTGGVTTNGAVIKSVVISVSDEYGIYNYNHLRFGDTVLLEAWRNGNDKNGRVYIITVVVTDMSGNRTTASTQVIVPHNMPDQHGHDADDDCDQEDEHDKGHSQRHEHNHDHQHDSEQEGKQKK